MQLCQTNYQAYSQVNRSTIQLDKKRGQALKNAELKKFGFVGWKPKKVQTGTRSENRDYKKQFYWL